MLGLLDHIVGTGCGQAMLDFRQRMTRQVKIIVEKHTDGYVAYPLGLKGTVVGEGGSYEEALADVKSAIKFHIETFGADVQPDDSPLLEAFVAEATIPA
jgi:predicted RNase H-like HicB family nuclease